MSNKSNPSTRFVLISDTHGMHRKFSKQAPLPHGDVLIHCGDFTNTGKGEVIKDFVKWMKEQPFEKKIVIAGNHDITLDSSYYNNIGKHLFHGNCKSYDCEAVRRILTDDKDIIYLEDSACVVNNFLIYGSPWTPRFCNWAFNVQRGKPCLEKWKLIPDEADILLTHG
eukprot:g6279.t1